MSDGTKGLAERAGGLVAAAKVALECAREATLPEECTAMELKALGRLKVLPCCQDFVLLASAFR
eukprot:COSAG06_NODE_1813_length_8305_cov_5.110407_12_plen_64_part_00